MCRGGEIVLSGWSQSFSCGLQWEVEGSSDLVPGPCGESKVFFSPPTQPGILLTHHITSEGFFLPQLKEMML